MPDYVFLKKAFSRKRKNDITVMYPSRNVAGPLARERFIFDGY